MFDTRYFDSVRSYMPEGAKAVLDAEIPRIRETIKKDVEEFADHMGRYLKAEIDKVTAEQATLVELQLANIKQQLTTLESKAPEDAAVKALRESIDKYESQWTKLGESVKAAAVAAMKSMGIPLPL